MNFTERCREKIQKLEKEIKDFQESCTHPETLVEREYCELPEEGLYWVNSYCPVCSLVWSREYEKGGES